MSTKQSKDQTEHNRAIYTEQTRLTKGSTYRRREFDVY